MIKNFLVEREENKDVARFLLVNFKCPHCLRFMKVIKSINLRLPINKRIQTIDCMHWENYGVKLEPLMDKFEKDGLSEGYPLCFITLEGIEQGIIIEPADPEVLKSYLNKLFEDEFIY